VTHLRQMMLDELQRRNYSQSTMRSYIFAVDARVLALDEAQDLSFPRDG